MNTIMMMMMMMMMMMIRHHRIHYAWIICEAKLRGEYSSCHGNATVRSDIHCSATYVRPYWDLRVKSLLFWPVLSYLELLQHIFDGSPPTLNFRKIPLCPYRTYGHNKCLLCINIYTNIILIIINENTNLMQQSYFFISPQSSTLHVSGVTSTHHQELQTFTIRYGITWSRYKPVDVESSANRVLCVCSPCTSVYRAGRSRISKWSEVLLVSLSTPETCRVDDCGEINT